ncbi:carbon-nitrogen hydrolase family protein [Candidatus Poribacteria bacterium]|nr:carbon-nitrogen hydrolase family protein [Candidatus Poribacteria bacterium]MBT5532976.1 carbon-nitrogen hydrolase family protein [Candidatus Poribacteria bacterium]MBT5710752.1 carbon-nitrogen hydrolase family protein [Candidatus Poribacteria bacterium]MBT7097066.1 carbon-nitrogen hydrolase family protein [Candidatus Poribacteria bacterium]MBT7805205.1 carbon-nitrogen hydrolase family protein [Candidatus Poribacteria bacterium]
MSKTIRVAAIQTKRRTISYKIGGPEAALPAVRENLDELVALAERAADMGCDIVALPEDTLGVLEWESGHWDDVAALLRPAEAEMLARLGEVAARRNMAIICCNDCSDGDDVYNTAILLGRDGEEAGRYLKVQLPVGEQARTRGDRFPVFDVEGIGSVGMCICYDMVFPETTRALALGGADIVFHLTMGGASMAKGDASLAAFRTRAADNFIYLVVAFRGGGSMVIGPQGEILADGGGEPDAIVTADIDLSGGREAGDALGGTVTDFRARLFGERVPSAYGILTDPAPPGVGRLRHIDVPSREAAAALSAEGMTTGADAFYEADRLRAEGETDEARRQFQHLAEHFGTLWIGRVARERLAAMDD